MANTSPGGSKMTCNVIDNFVCGNYIFNSDFDSGNLGRVNLVSSSPDLEAGENNIHAEYNVWTTPDCYGTPNESPNRTWFFFSIRGGRPNKNVKINVKNLNRQSKLFNQGMQPVMRIGSNGRWERIKDKPVFGMEMENFCMSFIHRPMELPHIEHYYAFTYPFTYTECQNMLEKFDRKFQKSADDLNYLIQRIVNPTLVANKIQTPITNSENSENKNKVQNINSGGNFQTQLSLTENLFESSIYEGYSDKEVQNEIYYHRELLVNSLEGRRVDLLTISSFRGILENKEGELRHLFPDRKERCHMFKDKKIIFLSSRVHPGETPASFVLNGFINLLLDSKSIIGATLRQLYVFKIVPILNPDGVYRGHYRTDTLGQNLNRMYINPQLDIHPSIYAVKKLLRFYHVGSDDCDEENSNIDGTSELSLKNDSSSSSLSCDNTILKNVHLKARKDNQNNNIDNKSSTDSYKDCTSSDGEDFTSRTNNNITKCPEENISKDLVTKEVNDELIPDLEPVVDDQQIKSISSCQPFAVKSPRLIVKRVIEKTVLGSIHNASSEPKSKELSRTKKTLHKKELKGSICKNSAISTSKSSSKKGILSSHNSNYTAKKNMLNLERGSNSEKSSIFLYIDFHGHASKKGVFMYGNHFSNSLEAVECMLLPRLMSINCHHFHYDACNFSERNMYRREKRDGLSKEGSGRVAVYKMTGIIKSYTLESNYNTGKYVNHLPARGKGNAMKIMNIIPPKYTPAVYEEVGRALGPSILDLTNSNSLSRLHNSDFRTLQGLRITLRNELERNISNRSISTNVTAKVQPTLQTTKRNKRNSLSASTTLPSHDTSKENKGAYSRPWESDSTATSSCKPSTLQSKVQLKQTRGVKKNTLKIRSTTFFGRRESCKKKPKVPLEQSTSKKDQQFHVPTKKAKVVTRKDSARLPSQKSLSPHPSSSIYLDVGTSTEEIYYPCKSSDSDYGDCKPLDASNSSCSIVKLSNVPNNSSSSIVTILTATALVEDAKPSCSGMASFSSTHDRDIREKNRTQKNTSKVLGMASDASKKRVQNAFGGSATTKLLKKKRTVRHDSAVLKRIKSKFKNPLH